MCVRSSYFSVTSPIFYHAQHRIWYLYIASSLHTSPSTISTSAHPLLQSPPPSSFLTQDFCTTFLLSGELFIQNYIFSSFRAQPPQKGCFWNILTLSFSIKLYFIFLQPFPLLLTDLLMRLKFYQLSGKEKLKLDTNNQTVMNDLHFLGSLLPCTVPILSHTLCMLDHPSWFPYLWAMT